MPRILVFQHVAFEILGTLNPLFKSCGFRIRYVNFGRQPEARPDISGYDGLVVLGGPMNVDERSRHPHLSTEVELIQEALDAEIPMLGICLGAQLIARALGAAVVPGGHKEIGWYDVAPTDAGRADRLLHHMGGPRKIFQWHGDRFEIPEGAVRLASSEICDNQAFRYRENVYGFQFHLEVDAALIERWLTTPVHRQEIEALAGRIDPEAIRRATPEHIGPLEQLSNRVFGEFAALFGPLRRRERRPHR